MKQKLKKNKKELKQKTDKHENGLESMNAVQNIVEKCEILRLEWREKESWTVTVVMKTNWQMWNEKTVKKQTHILSPNFTGHITV